MRADDIEPVRKHILYYTTPISSRLCLLKMPLLIHYEGNFCNNNKKTTVQVWFRFGQKDFLSYAFVSIFWSKQQQKDLSDTPKYTARVSSKVHYDLLQVKVLYELKFCSVHPKLNIPIVFSLKLSRTRTALDGSTKHATRPRVSNINRYVYFWHSSPQLTPKRKTR